MAIAELDDLKERMRLAGKLRMERPTDRDAFEPGTVVTETILATKVIIPHWILKTSVPGVRELAVWVADPSNDLRTLSDASYDFTGTFLYLVTPIYEIIASDTFYSGCSALQIISNMTSGKPFLTPDHAEPLGRRNSAHPTDKLKSIGGIVVDRRSLDVLYMPRYMSDEQCFTKDEKTYRVHDLLGYPLYIANSFEFWVKRRVEQVRSRSQKTRKPKSRA